jgi:hypothetical protein
MSIPNPPPAWIARALLAVILLVAVTKKIFFDPDLDITPFAVLGIASLLFWSARPS